MFFFCLLVGVFSSTCDSFTQIDYPTNSKYLLKYKWLGAYCDSNNCNLPKSKFIMSDSMIIDSLQPIYNDNIQTCCDFDGRKDDLDNYVPQLISYNYFMQSQIDSYWSSLVDCNAPEKAYIKYGTCMPSKFNSVYGYFNATFLLFQDYNVWTILRHYNIERCEDCLYSKQKMDQLLQTRGFQNKVQWICADQTKPNMLTDVNVCFLSSQNSFGQTDCPTLGDTECGDYFYFNSLPDIEHSDNSCDY
ncbi:Uncharacterized protein QTN25_001705 [Entamoeba marina]